jgi:hypothetical protein
MSDFGYRVFTDKDVLSGATPNNFKWSESSTTTETNYPLYKDFDEYFKTIAPHLWLVKQWDNETIKIWLENAFEDGRK